MGETMGKKLTGKKSAMRMRSARDDSGKNSFRANSILQNIRRKGSYLSQWRSTHEIDCAYENESEVTSDNH